jgi:hypothetical protein
MEQRRAGPSNPFRGGYVLVVMPARNETDQAVRIRKVVDPHFALDIIVWTPRNLAWRLEEGDWFLREIVGRAKNAVVRRVSALHWPLPPFGFAGFLCRPFQFGAQCL